MKCETVRIYTCESCGKREAWGGNWRWKFASKKTVPRELREYVDPERLTYCSTECAKEGEK